jgi:GrpB-like predicted nucleotidyltransferase (UPF0157 family)
MELHVDFESANPSASRFWPRHFTPALASLKRSIFADARDQRRRITVVDHDPAWTREYEAEAEALREALRGCLCAVHHIGSTAVPGLPAKPILDILAEVTDLDAGLGYRAMGEHGIEGRRYFQKGHPRHTHHLHIFRRGNPNVTRHLAFRDYLRAHPERAREYGELKLRLARKDPYDVEGYLEGKKELVSRLQEQAFRWRGL